MIHLRRFSIPAMTCLAVALSADSGLWPDGILDVPTAQGTGLATVAYDAATDTSHFWLIGDVQGGQGYVLSGNTVASLLAYNTGDAGPSYVRFFGEATLTPGLEYRLSTSNAKAVPGGTAPPSIFESLPFHLTGGKPEPQAIPEPTAGILVLVGLAAMWRRRA